MKSAITIIAATVIALWTFGNVEAVPPDISYDWPTPDDGATVTESTVQVKAVITESDLAEATFQWAGIDYTIYDSSLALMFNFNNVGGLGEDYQSLSPIVDVSGSGNNGQLGGAAEVPFWTESAGFQGAFEFSGTQSILVMHNTNGSLDPGGGDFAIALWILPLENVDADIMRKGSTETTVGYDMWYKLEHSAMNSDNKISLNFNTNGTDATIYSTDSYADTDWVFVVAQRRGNQAELWIDGVLNGTATVTGEIYNEANLTLGSKDTQNDDFYEGMLDEVRIYRRSFSDDEVRLLYDSMLSQSDQALWTLEVKRDGLESGDYTYAVSATNASAETGSNQRTVTVALPAPPDVTLMSPANGSVLNNPTVMFTVGATDPMGLLDATLYIGTPEQVATFSGPAETDDVQITADTPDVADGGAVSINVDGLNPHAHAVIKFPNLIGSGAGQVTAGSTIVSATLQINCTNYGAMMQVYRLTSDWAEDTVTWNSPWVSPGGDYDAATVVNGDCTATGLRTIDITGFVQAWSDGTPNYGVLFTDTGTDGVDFDTSEGGNPPVLTVVYAGDWQPVQTQLMSGTSDTATFTDIDIVLEDMTDYVWNCLVTNAAYPPMSSWAPDNFNLSIDSQTPDEPLLVGPADGATGVTMPATLEVTVSDPQAEDVLDVTFYGRKKVSAADDFEIVVLPDTQNYCEFPENAHIFTAQTQWIVDNIGTRNIVFVTQEGDIVENPGSTVEYDRAKASMSVLDPGLADLSDLGLPDPLVPYGVCPGNHDTPTGPPPSGYYNEYFPYTHYEGRNLTWYGGHYPITGNDSSYQLFSAGGVDFIAVHLEYNPGSSISDPPIAWADSVLKTYPDRFAIITTHAYMDTNANRIAEGAGIWNVLVQGNDNVYLVLCGHMHGETRRTDVVNGRQVHQILADYQSRANGGDGWLRTMRFAPAENKMYVETYSPYRGEYETDADSQFALDVPLNWFTEIGTNLDVANGSNTSLVWTDLEEASEYEWYVTVTDSTSRTIVGPDWSFTTGLTVRASSPSPADGATQVATDAILSWTAGQSANWHDVYFGTDQTTVANADTSTTGIYQGRQDLGNETYSPGPLEGKTDYYWRIDEVEADGSTIHAGNVWSFTTMNQSPVVADDPDYSVDEDSTLVVDGASIAGVLANDTDPENDPLTAILVSDVSSGVLNLNSDGTFSYSPDPDFSGTDTFTYKANDGTSDSANAATVTITVIAINDPPTASDDIASTLRDVPVDIDVLGNDNDTEGDTLSVGEVSQPANGSVVNNGANVTYTPNPGYTGEDSFTYKAYDDTENGNAATVTVTVNAPGPTTLFSDGFESGELATGGWTSSGSVVVKEPASYEGVYGVQIGGTASIAKSVSTVGFANIHVKYARTTKGMDSGESLTVEWSADGTTWNNVIESTQDTAWLYQDVALGAEAGENAAFSVRFHTNADKTNEYGSVDSVEIIGTPAGPDLSPPMPNPMTWATVPHSTGETSIAMVATTASDASGVEYYFACTAGGGHDSGWQDSPTYEDTGLAAGTQYTYTVKARDKSANQNETASSTPASATTDALDSEPPSPDPMTWATVPHSTGETSIAMVATTASDASGVEYYFACTAGGGHDSGWQDSPTYEDTGLAAATQYTYTVKARDKSANQNETAPSTPESATTDAPDSEPPSPDPMTWATAPYAAGTTSISMTATTASDASGVQYYFTCTAGGGHDSGWQDSPTYEDTGLQPDTQYTYQVTARDKSPNQNQTAPSGEASATTSGQQVVYVASMVERPFEPAGKNVKAVVGITISIPEAGATVTGDWYLNDVPIASGTSGITDAAGYREIVSVPEKAKTGDIFRFVVTDVVLSGYVYDPAQNVVTEISIQVP